MATLAAPVTDAETLFDPNTVKLVQAANGDALYFSRAPLPWPRDAFARDRTGCRKAAIGCATSASTPIAPASCSALPRCRRAPGADRIAGTTAGARSGYRIAVAHARHRSRRASTRLTILPAPKRASPAMPESQAPVRLLVVCLGNICRSPMAEGVLRARIAASTLAGQVIVDSVGHGHWQVGQPRIQRAISTAARHGVDISGLRAARSAATTSRATTGCCARTGATCAMYAPSARWTPIHAAHCCSTGPAWRRKPSARSLPRRRGRVRGGLGLLDRAARGVLARLGTAVLYRGGACARA
jgi:protein-tyrosine phosphatase